MKMSEGVEWALHCVAVLASLPEGVALPARSLAEFHGISESYLLKHLPALAQHGVLESIPGPKGGYRLARPADTITFLDVVEAVEGPAPAFRCTEIRQRGPIAGSPETYRAPCAIHAVMREAERAWKDTLRRQTIGDLARHLTETLDPERRAAAAVWIGARVRPGGSGGAPSPAGDGA